MKKVKLTTMTLALLAGTVVAPIVSTAAELEKQATVETTEVVKEEAKAEGEETPVAPTEETTPAPEQKEEPKGGVAQPTAPAAKTEEKAPTQKAELVDKDAELRDAIQAARDEAYARHIAGDITYAELEELDARIVACQSVEEVNQIISWMNVNINPALTAAKEAAIREVDGLGKRISEANRDAYVTRIDAAGSQAQIDAVLVEARAEAALFDAKLAAKSDIQGLVDGYGFTDEDALVFFPQIDKAKSEAEVNAIVADAKAAAEIGAIRYAGLVELNELLVAGTITTDEYYVYANQIDVANSQEEVDSILAAAGEFVDLKEYKKEAHATLSELVHAEKLSMDDYAEFMGELEAATNKAEVDQVLAHAQTRVELNEAKAEATKTVLALAHAEKISSGDYWNAKNAIDAATTIAEVDAAVAAAQAIADLNDAKEAAIREVDALLDANKIIDTNRDDYVTRIDAATSVEEINSVLEEARAEAAISDARVEAIKEIQGLVNGTTFTQEDSYEFINQLYDANSVEEINSIVEAAKALLELNEVKELAKEVILELAHAELIDSGEYWDFVEAIDAATSIEEVNSIVDEANQLAALRQAKIDAKDELFFMLTTGDIDLFDFWHFEEVLENADTLEAVTAVVPAAEALVQARISAEDELSAFVDEGLLTNDEFRDFVAQTKEVRSAEEVEAIMVEARALADSRRIEEITESTVTVKFVDAKGNEIKDSESLTKEVGATHLFVAPAIEGYELQGPSSLELTFSDAPQTITFTYNKLEEAKKESTITVNYLDKDGKEVKASDKLVKEVGTKEVIQAPAIKGYKVVGPTALKVEFVELDQTVAFTYEKVKEDGGKDNVDGGKDNKGKDNKDNKGNKGESKKDGNKKSELPQTGEAAANAGLVAGGILSMLSAAFVFFRKGK